MLKGLQTISSRLPSLGNIEIDIKIDIHAKQIVGQLFICCNTKLWVLTKIVRNILRKYASFPCINKLIEMDVNR